MVKVILLLSLNVLAFAAVAEAPAYKAALEQWEKKASEKAADPMKPENAVHHGALNLMSTDVLKAMVRAYTQARTLEQKRTHLQAIVPFLVKALPYDPQYSFIESASDVISKRIAEAIIVEARAQAQARKITSEQKDYIIVALGVGLNLSQTEAVGPCHGQCQRRSSARSMAGLTGVRYE